MCGCTRAPKNKRRGIETETEVGTMMVRIKEQIPTKISVQHKKIEETTSQCEMQIAHKPCQ